MGKKTRECQKAKIPFMFVIGDKEMESGSVAIRKYGERQSETISTEGLFIKLEELLNEKVPASLRE